MSAAAQRAASRSSSGTHVCRSGPTYREPGRITLLSAYCSRTCAVQPAIRAAANTGVMRSVGAVDAPRRMEGPGASARAAVGRPRGDRALASGRVAAADAGLRPDLLAAHPLTAEERKLLASQDEPEDEPEST